jgi:hypothetical protein
LKDRAVAMKWFEVVKHKLFTKATTHGKQFSVMGGLHLILDDVFISAEMLLWEKEKSRLMIERNWCQRLMTIDAKAKVGGDGSCCILSWYGIWKLNTMRKANKIQK